METPAPEPTSPNLFASSPIASDVIQKLAQGMGVRKPLLLVTGESGMGKTPTVRAAMEVFGDRATIAWMLEPNLDVKELGPTLLALFGGSARPGTSPLAHAERLLMTLANATAGGRVAVLVVDDAHTLSDDVLLELQRLADRAAQRQCPLEIVLVGQTTLAARLSQPALAAVNNNISLRFDLSPLNAHHTRRYLLLLPAPPGAERPAQFSRKACRDIHAASHGISRDIEALAAESARRAAHANSAVVSPEHVRAAVEALGARPRPRPATPVAAAKPATPAAVSKPATPAASTKPAAAPAPAKSAQAAKPAAPVAKPAPAQGAPPAKPPRTEAKSPEPVEDAAKPELGSSVDAPSAEDAAPAAAAGSSWEPGTSGEFVPSDDPRVKDWVSRFGGSGVRLGGMYTGPVPDEPVESEVESAAIESEVVRGARPIRSDAIETPPMASAGGSLDVRGEVAWPPPPPSARASKPKKGPVLGKSSGSGLLWPAVALLLAVALGAVVLMQRRAMDAESSATLKPPAQESVAEKEPAAKVKPAAPAKPKKDERKAASGASATLPERTDRADRTRNARRPDTNAVTIADRADPSQPVTHARKKAELEIAKSGRAYTILVGSFLKSDMAFAEREHLSRLTNHPVWVSRRSINGVRTYRIILGAFESTEIAESAAQSLLQRGLIRDAQVLSLPLD